ncbi:MAG: four helix bundle protein [Planctomycetota bacterium]|nr:four helix bundle protein [Planctomycetota bacterium]
MAMVRTFRDLIAWQRSMTLAAKVYELTGAMPKEERFGLTLQMRRAAVSIPSNIAEGHGRQSRMDYLKFLRIARGSLAELTTQLELAHTLRMVAPDESIQRTIEETDRVLQGLIRALEKKRDR